MSARDTRYDPFARGRSPVGVRTIRIRDAARDRSFSCEVWYPAAAPCANPAAAPPAHDVFTVPTSDAPRRQMALRNAAAQRGIHPLIVFSHPSGGHRRTATFLCTHLGSHGYVVAALDHSEVSQPELARRDGESDAQEAARVEALIASRVPDVRFLLDHLLGSAPWAADIDLDRARVGITGHSFGGWTALAATAADPRIGAVVALAPGGSSKRKPGILPLRLDLPWDRDVPTLFVVAENDAWLPLAGMYEVFAKTPTTKQMVILRRADHLHFMDNVEETHEATRTMPWAGELAWIAKDIRASTAVAGR